MGELEDRPSFPAGVRDYATDFLCAVQESVDPFSPIAPRIAKALAKVGTNEIVDLCSGGAGPWGRLLPALDRHGPTEAAKVVLTDLFPNVKAFEREASRQPGRVYFETKPVDATSVRSGRFYTMFNAFHHFDEPLAREILQNAVRTGAGIGIFEAADRSASFLLGVATLPLQVLWHTPKIEPRSAGRWMMTYLLPAVPAVALVDGLISALRTYSPAELQGLVTSLDGHQGYEWEIGRERYLGPLAVTYLIGVPRRAEADADNDAKETLR